MDNRIDDFSASGQLVGSDRRDRADIREAIRRFTGEGVAHKYLIMGVFFCRMYAKIDKTSIGTKR